MNRVEGGSRENGNTKGSERGNVSEERDEQPGPSGEEGTAVKKGVGKRKFKRKKKRREERRSCFFHKNAPLKKGWVTDLQGPFPARGREFPAVPKGPVLQKKRRRRWWQNVLLPAHIKGGKKRKASVPRAGS